MQISPSTRATVATQSPRPVGPRLESDEPRAKILGSSAGLAATRVQLSPEAKKASAEAQQSGQATPPGQELSEEDREQIEKLKARDAEVRAHEQAHVAAAGGYINGGIHYDYQRGPDNKQYAIGGHVDIDTSEIPGDPEATIRKAQIVRRAALAPADPSGADRQVAAKATRTMNAARAEISEQKAAEAGEPAGQKSPEQALGAQTSDENHTQGRDLATAGQSYIVRAYAQHAA